MFIFLFSLLVSFLVISFYIEKLFLFLYIALAFVFIYTYSLKKGIGVMVLSFLFLFLIPDPQLSSIDQIEGKVIYVDEDKAIVKMKDFYVQIKNISLKAGQVIKANFHENKIEEASNFNGFDYKNYLYGQDIYHIGEVSQVLLVDQSFSLYQYLYDKIKTFDTSISSYSFLFLLGIKEESIKDLYTQLGNLSIVHLFALSGMHIHVLFNLLDKLLFSLKYKKYMILLLTGYYVFSLPLMISFKRAYLMKLLTILFKGKINSLQAFSLTLLYFIYQNPYVFYNLSFLFSFTLTFFILILEKEKSTSLFLYLASLPLILYQKSELTLFGFLFGLLFSPVIKILYSFVLIHFISFDTLSFFLKRILESFETLIHVFDHYNLLIILKRPSFLWILIYYLLLLLFIYHKQRGKVKYASFLPLWVFLLYISPYLNPFGEVTMIDVGQGDCFLIREPFQRSVVLIDTGGSAYQDLATNTIIPYLKSKGISKIDKVYISHDDMDHSGALSSLLNHFKVKEVQKEFVESDQVGSLNFKMLAYPIDLENENDQSLVLYVKIGNLYYLFTGDITEKTEKYLFENYASLQVDVLKVAHHGSHSSSSVYLTQWIHPSIALISVKKDNLYHHPHQDVIERLEKNGIQIYRTDLNGMVTIRYSLLGEVIFSKKDIHAF